MGNNVSIRGRLTRGDSLKLMSDELKLRIDAYQKYINTALQVNAFYYAITGAVLGFYLNKPDGRAVYFLLLPIFIGAVLGGIFLYAARLQKGASKKINDITNKINEELYPGMEIKTFDDVDLLRLLLLIFAYIFFIVCIALTLMPFMRKFIEVLAFPHLIVFGLLAFFSLIAGRYATHIINLKYKGAMMPNNKDKIRLHNFFYNRSQIEPEKRKDILNESKESKSKE